MHQCLHVIRPDTKIIICFNRQHFLLCLETYSSIEPLYQYMVLVSIAASRPIYHLHWGGHERWCWGAEWPSPTGFQWWWQQSRRGPWRRRCPWGGIDDHRNVCVILLEVVSKWCNAAVTAAAAITDESYPISASFRSVAPYSSLEDLACFGWLATPRLADMEKYVFFAAVLTQYLFYWLVNILCRGVLRM